MNIVDQLVVVLELDSSKFKEGIAEAMTMLQSLSGIIKVVEKSVNAMSKEMSQAGSMGQTAANKTAAGFQAVQRAINNANAALGKFKTGMQSGQEGASKLNEEVTKTGSQGSTRIFGLVSTVMLVSMAIRALIREVIRLADELDKLVGIKALKTMAMDAAEAADKLWRFADGLHLGVVELQAWHDQIRMWGGDAAAFDKTVEAVSGKIGAMGTKLRGGKQAMEAFKISGITDEMIKAKDAFTVLEKISETMGKGGFGKGDAGDQRMLAVKRALGIDENTFQMMKQAGISLVPVLQEIKKMANDPAEIRNATMSALEWRKLEIQWEHTKMTLVSELQPALKKLGELLNDVLKWVKNNPDEARNIFYGLAAAVTVVAIAMSLLTVIAATLLTVVLGPLVLMMYQIAKSFRGAGSAADSFTNKLRMMYNVAMPLARFLTGLFSGGPLSALSTLAIPEHKMSLVQAPLTAAQTGVGSISGHEPRSMSVEFGKVEVYSNAADGEGLAKDFMKSLAPKFRSLGHAYQVEGMGP